MSYDKKYYKGGHRITIGGVPCRVAHKPGKTALALMRGQNPRPERVTIPVEPQEAPDEAARLPSISREG